MEYPDPCHQVKDELQNELIGGVKPEKTVESIRSQMSETFDKERDEVAHQPNTVTPTILNNFVIFWSIQYLTLSNPLDEFLKHIVCPHTVKMLVNSERSQELVWTCLADMFVYLEENKLISPQSISKQFLEVLQYAWPQEYFKYFRTCLCKISSLSSNCFLEFELMKLKDFCEDDRRTLPHLYNRVAVILKLFYASHGRFIVRVHSLVVAVFDRGSPFFILERAPVPITAPELEDGGCISSFNNTIYTSP
uniref:Uncharacterized protein n=1 Tax=Timema monikensis TaxID=170555 RepID=A0A7R9HTF2_9NEOP|nr:unnamed protein product [Timema monikensis]